MDPVDKLNVIILAAAGGIATYLAYRNEKLGAGLLVGITTIALLHLLLSGS